MALNLVGYRVDADQFFSDSRPIRLRYGSTEILPRPLVVFQQSKTGEDVNSPLSDSSPVDGYAVSIATTTLDSLLGGSAAVQTAIAPGSRWDVNHGDSLGWRQCYVAGDPNESGMIDYQFSLVRISIDEQ